MKNCCLAVLIILFMNFLHASDMVVNSELKDVKVFLSGAELIHTVNFNFSPGSNTIVITDLANSINSNSLNVKGNGNFLILDSKIIRDYLLEREKTEQIKLLKDSLESVEREIEVFNSDIQVSQSEIDLILANKKLGTESKSPSVDEIKRMQNFYKTELSKLHKEIIDHKIKIRDLQETAEKLRKQLTEINGTDRKSSVQIVVTILAEKSGKGSLEIKYFTGNAGWTPAYDIRVNDLDKPLTLNQKAMVWQNTGINWQDKSLVLSSGNPSQSSNLPELYPWRLDFERDNRLYKSRGIAADYMMSEVEEAPPPAPMAAEFISVTVVENLITHEFVSPLKYTIFSDNKEYMVHLKDYDIRAEYTYYTVPKLSDDVFLTAKIKDWGNSPILPGNANIFFENTFIGNTNLSLNNAEEEIRISLGRDPNISVKREEIEDFSEDKFLSSDIERRFDYKISVKNNKSKPIDMEVEDQLPLSSQEDIEVKVINLDGAGYDSESGRLTWNFNLDSGSITEKKLSFSVRFPGDKNIRGLQ